MSEEYKVINQDILHVEIHKYIKEKGIKIESFEDMKDNIINMMKDKICFNIERERLRECMEDITFQLLPNDENKERILEGLEYEDEGDDLDLNFNMQQEEDIE